ncbi:MAG: metallophosphoesterase [Gammaproteobacteria bacterium]
MKYSSTPADALSSASIPYRHERPSARLVQISDPHLLSRSSDLHRTVNTSDSLERVLSHAQSFIEDADAVLLTGDIAQDEKAATYERLYASWTDEWIGRDTPVWCLPGNHDAPVPMQSTLNQAPFTCLGHHSLDNWEVVALDSRNPGKASGLLGQQELERLEQRLNNSPAEHLLLALHHHALPLGNSWLDSVGLEDRGAFEKLVSGHSRVRAVIFGHIHHHVDRVVKGVRYLGCPSTCVQFKAYQREFELDIQPPGFRILSLYPSGAIDTQIIWSRTRPVKNGQLTDSGEEAAQT